MANANPTHGNTTCPEGWIEFGSKCFYVSEHTSNWTFSQTSCMELGAHLTQFETQEELVRKDWELVWCFLLEYALA